MKLFLFLSDFVVPFILFVIIGYGILMKVPVYDTFVKEGTCYITDDITAEMCKLIENTYRDVNIALANELSIICDKLGIDVFNLIELANKHPRVNILKPRSWRRRTLFGNRSMVYCRKV